MLKLLDEMNATMAIIIVVIFVAAGLLIYDSKQSKNNQPVQSAVESTVQDKTASTTEIAFPKDGSIEKTASLEESADPNFWLNSSQKLTFADSTTSTGDKLRLITKKDFGDSVQSVYFNVSSANDNLEERKADNMVGLYIRYVDEKNYYSVGIGADGKVRIEKASDGEEADLLFPQRQLFPGKYDKTKNPDLIPTADFGLKVEATNSDNGSVTISTFMDWGDGTWAPLGAVVDSELNPLFPDPNPNYLFSRGHGGVISDHMNVSFKDYSIRESQ